jgi:hypothetical protein
VGASPEQLEREIEATRADLTRTIGAIEEKVADKVAKANPKRVLRENKQVLAGIGGGIAALFAILVVRKVRSHN